jgi:hypothetical protein
MFQVLLLPDWGTLCSILNLLTRVIRRFVWPHWPQLRGLAAVKGADRTWLRLGIYKLLGFGENIK